MKISQKNFMKAWNNKKLIAGALKYAHVRRDYDRYDDLYQNAVLIYAQMLEEHSDLPLEQIDKLSFRKIIWMTLNELKKIKHYEERNGQIEEAFEVSQSFNYEDLAILHEELQKLREIERVILVDHVLYKRKLKDLYREYEINPASIRRVKARLLKRMREKFKEK